MADTPYVSLADFAATFHDAPSQVPPWLHSRAILPLPLDALGLRYRIEDVVDTVVALQRAEWLEDGVFVGPHALGEVYRDVLECARALKVAVPPAMVGAISVRSQGVFGTDGRAFLALSSFFFQSAPPEERRFVAGRLCGLIAARLVTAGTLYALLVDQSGLRSMARRNLGPILELVLAPVSLGVRLALARWHRAAEISADRAGLLCAGSVEAAGAAMLRIALGVQPDVSPEEYLQQLKSSRSGASPGRWTELLASHPWMHKRIEALELFARSEVYASWRGEAMEGALDRAELDARTDALLGVR